MVAAAASRARGGRLGAGRGAAAASHAQPAGMDSCEQVAANTREMYRAPRVCGSGVAQGDHAQCSLEWPRYCHGEFRHRLQHGWRFAAPCMLELSCDEIRALRVITLRVKVAKERYGGPHHFNWKKVGLSMAVYKEGRFDEDAMPTARAKAAYRWLRRENRYYEAHCVEQARRVAAGQSLWLSSYDLFVAQRGIECAAFPHLYPTTAFTDTGLLEYYQETTQDATNRVCSIGQSWTRKVLSSVRAYGESNALAFYLYERHLAHKFFFAHSRGQKYGVTADVMCRDSQLSAGYWEVVQDANADLVRVMRDRCFDEKYAGGKLHRQVRENRGQVPQCSQYL